jgi:hypothetical protein
VLARLFVLLPFSVVIPEGEEFTVYEYEDDGYAVRVYPPLKSDRPSLPEGVEQIKMDEISAFQADALRIDFYKESFNRTKDILLDPPENVIRRAINAFILRLKHVTRAYQIHSIDFPNITWRIRYLNDDETELDIDEQFIRGRGGLQFSFTFIGLNKKVWEDINGLPPDYEPPPWEELLLEAQFELPRVGPAVVLAATALEVFIAQILDHLAKVKPTPLELWSWINNRGDYLREPTVEEQYDVLLKFFTGRSLKAEGRLWESFKNLKTARNSFVHEGRAKVGGTPVSIDAAKKLVASAQEIVSTIREWLPQELYWPVFKHSIRIEALKKLT